jgi:hypothetical protein
MKKISLRVAEVYNHLNADKILLEEKYINDAIMSLNEKIELEVRLKKDKSEAFKAAELNEVIRKLINKNEILFEVYEQHGVFHFGHGNKKGFDFAFIDHELNIIKMWNNCFGERVYSDGKERYENFVKKSEIYKKLNKTLELDKENSGIDISGERKKPIIVGEIQFGNWALKYYDLLKVFSANTTTDIDAMIYITCTGNLEKYLSDGIVTYPKVYDALQEFKKVIQVPIMLIGLDFQE